ncbi:NACHT domain-containing protein [Vibrio campbellii]|uniref:NACHT domain-containing protein n=1 Tax=Vibrio campbellii TaxID=680 RepID=UPI00142E26C9|nr:hypothetical protein [Vibrio campbellii]NIY87607.1 hypothetical protein [Vibrio campbellii]NVK68626.1 hypothetical protein [Vibrio campbellii]
MIRSSIERSLWFEYKGDRKEITESELNTLTEPLVILGEAGMGKSFLLNRLSEHAEYQFCTARKLIRSCKPSMILGNARVLVIDALDEVSSQKDGAAVDSILQKLQEIGCPSFILSCRVADWQSATAINSINEDYSKKPIELHLMPFNHYDIQSFLSLSLGEVQSQNVVQHFNDLGLGQLLGNPQTLELISKVARSGDLPNSKGELFERAIDVLWCEHNDTRAQTQLDKETTIKAAGAAFASLILTGNEALTRKAAANIAEGELSFTDIRTLPNAEALNDVIAARLFKSNGVDRFTYIHRSIGEYLGAKWLAQHSNTGTNKRRFLSLFYCDGLVPASLRGIHAWLAQDSTLKPLIIENDPMGFIEYGDADVLTVNEARILLAALQKLAIEDPHFRDWKRYSTRGLIHDEIIEEIQQLIVSSNTVFGLRKLLLEAFIKSKESNQLTDNLKRIVLDKKDIFSIRSTALEVIIESKCRVNLSAILNTLLKFDDADSLRLIMEAFQHLNFENIEDEFIVDTVISYAGKEQSVIGVLYSVERTLPEHRISNILDLLTNSLTKLGKWHDRAGDHELTDFSHHLILRNLQSTSVSPERVWAWLSPLSGSQCSNLKELSSFIDDKKEIRLAIQKWVLLDSPVEQSIRERNYLISDSLPILMPQEQDLILLLSFLDRGDQRWKELLQLYNHNDENGAKLRQAALPFAENSIEDLEWLDNLPKPQIPSWQIRQEEKQRKHLEKIASQHAVHRQQYHTNISKMRGGNYQDIVNPAMAYLKLFNDIGHKSPAHERIEEWLGDELSEAAFEGFEAYLTHKPFFPTLSEVMKIREENKRYYAEYINIVAVTERIRKEMGLQDLPDDVILSVLFSLRFLSHLEQHAGISEFRVTHLVENEVETRGLWETATRRFYEPQLEAKKEFVPGLHELMRNEDKRNACHKLAFEWLQRFNALNENTETLLIKRLVYSYQFDELRELLHGYIDLKKRNHRPIWDAVCFIVDFENTTEKIDGNINSDLIWILKDLLQGHYRHGSYLKLTFTQIEWVVKTFRAKWPIAEHPNEETFGSQNAWDASQFINSFIDRIGSSTDLEAVKALRRLRHAPEDSYTDRIKVVTAEQHRLLVEASYTPMPLMALKAITSNTLPKSMADLQALIIEELEVVQAKIRSDDVDSRCSFYDDNNVAHKEERCSSALIGLLRQGVQGIEYTPELHVANDKEVDITCSVEKLRLPIEVKGQWHKDLWHAADTQLDRLYTQDWRAENRGIYLVLWFGDNQPKNKILQTPGRGITKPKTAEELQEMLKVKSQATQQGRVEIFVLDLE